MLAAWRRTGRGVWYLIYVVEGYDDYAEVRLPGRYSERKAIRVGRRRVAKELRVRKKYVILQSTYKEP